MPKADLHCSSAELVFGQTLRLPGEFFIKSHVDAEIPYFLTRLHDTFDNLDFTNPKRHILHKSFVSPDLFNCKFIFLRKARLKPAFSPLFEGPYEVVSRTNKLITVMKRGKALTVSIDRVKPAYLLNNVVDQPASIVTKKVRFQID